MTLSSFNDVNWTAGCHPCRPQMRATSSSVDTLTSSRRWEHIPACQVKVNDSSSTLVEAISSVSTCTELLLPGPEVCAFLFL